LVFAKRTGLLGLADPGLGRLAIVLRPLPCLQG
jgi:hypothetical protein